MPKRRVILPAGRRLGLIVSRDGSPAGSARSPLLLVGGTIGGVSTILYSTDGATFNSGTISNTGFNPILAVKNSTTVFAVAADGLNGKCYQSSNGQTWSELGAFPGNSGVYRLAWNNALGLLVAVGYKYPLGTAVLLYTSPDGINWTDRSPAVNGYFFGLGSGELTTTKLVATGQDSTGANVRSYSSQNGTAWNADTVGAPNNGAIYGVATDSTNWISINNAINASYRVNDGTSPLTWVADSATPVSLQLRRLNGRFVGCGTNTSTVGPTGVGDMTTVVIPAGTWRDVTYFSPTAEWFAVASAGANRCAKNATLATTGDPWTAVGTIPVGAYFSTVMF